MLIFNSETFLDIYVCVRIYFTALGSARCHALEIGKLINYNHLILYAINKN